VGGADAGGNRPPEPIHVLFVVPESPAAKDAKLKWAEAFYIYIYTFVQNFCTQHFCTKHFCTKHFCTKHFCTKHFCTKHFCTKCFCTKHFGSKHFGSKHFGSKHFCTKHFCTKRFCTKHLCSKNITLCVFHSSSVRNIFIKILFLLQTLHTKVLLKTLLLKKCYNCRRS
jgi:hypothetical protein